MTKTTWQERMIPEGDGHQLSDLNGVRYEEAEDVFNTNKRKREDLMTTFNVAGTDVKVERLTLVSFTSERVYSFHDVIDRSEHTQELDRHQSLAFFQSKMEKVDLFIPNALGGGKRLECTPYYQVPPGVSKLKRMRSESKPDILKANTNIFFVLAENQELVREFLTTEELEEYNDENAKTKTDYLIYMR